ncbi:hypothetical protein HMPREF1142_0264 [Peptostreptococcaceae bacterium AS15]|nr:hypothetical protein HMPREF1142_0264 [Peptostreptococcaceae bacterium AS15]
MSLLSDTIKNPSRKISDKSAPAINTLKFDMAEMIDCKLIETLL